MKKISILLGTACSLLLASTTYASTINSISQGATWGPSESCPKVNITDFLNQKCLGKEKCDVEATNDFFEPVTKSKDICPQHLKWMLFAYTCSNQDFPWVVIRSEGTHYQLNCAPL